MKRSLLIIAITFFASCTNGNDTKNAATDTSQSVVTIPTDSIEQSMSVVPMDTTKSNMPVVNPDTGKVVPK